MVPQSLKLKFRFVFVRFRLEKARCAPDRSVSPGEREFPGTGRSNSRANCETGPSDA
jgi:hypothetical protein